MMLFVYDLEAQLVPACVQKLKQLFTSYPQHEFEIVLVEDAHKPLNHKHKKAADCRVLQSTTPRQGNLRSYAWIREQIKIMAMQDADVVFKVDPDTLITSLNKFLAPFEQGFKGMVGYGREAPAPQTNVLGACYAIHVEGLRKMHTEIETMWNTVWMDVLLEYVREFVPSFGTFLPAIEDAAISIWFHHRSGLIVLPSSTCSSYPWLKTHVFEATDVVLLGNPGPACQDKTRSRALIAEEFSKTIPIPVKKR